MIKRILCIVTVVAILAVAVVTWIWATQPTSNIEQQRLYVEVYKAIGIGFLVALLGTILPNLILETRDNFERAKASRIAYSKAKTSVMYLPGTLAVLEYAEAMAVLQKAHRKLHIAETYEEELRKYLRWYGDKDTWVDQMYWELTAVRKLLQSHADQWKEMSAGDRTFIVDRALTAVRELFGIRGQKWQNLQEEYKESKASQVVATVSAPRPAFKRDVSFE